jgi:hypothetical protein
MQRLGTGPVSGLRLAELVCLLHQNEAAVRKDIASADDIDPVTGVARETADWWLRYFVRLCGFTQHAEERALPRDTHLWFVLQVRKYAKVCAKKWCVKAGAKGGGREGRCDRHEWRVALERATFHAAVPPWIPCSLALARGVLLLSSALASSLS